MPFLNLRMKNLYKFKLVKRPRNKETHKTLRTLSAQTEDSKSRTKQVGGKKVTKRIKVHKQEIDRIKKSIELKNMERHIYNQGSMNKITLD